MSGPCGGLRRRPRQRMGPGDRAMPLRRILLRPRLDRSPVVLEHRGERAGNRGAPVLVARDVDSSPPFCGEIIRVRACHGRHADAVQCVDLPPIFASSSETFTPSGSPVWTGAPHQTPWPWHCLYLSSRIARVCSEQGGCIRDGGQAWPHNARHGGQSGNRSSGLCNCRMSRAMT
jgi:hypothetical protein